MKGAPCTPREHFHGRVHDFRRCAPGVCTFFEPFIIAIHVYWEGAWSNFRVLWEVHPASAQDKSLISDTVTMCAKIYIKKIHAQYTFLFMKFFFVSHKVCVCVGGGGRGC